jgi:hypothetical protein
VWFRSKLGPGEGAWKGEFNVFSDNRLLYEFFIWNETRDANCCPSAGVVTGTYRVVHAQRFYEPQQRWVSAYRIEVASFQRSPLNEGKRPPSICEAERVGELLCDDEGLCC